MASKERVVLDLNAKVKVTEASEKDKLTDTNCRANLK
jgi:dihydroneopterin aldolase